MRIEVAGIPAPQGSKRHVGGGRMVEMSRAVGPWREAVRAETQRAVSVTQRDTPSGGFITVDPAIRAGLLGQPVALELMFWLRRPASAPKSRKHPVTRPDLDKLVRAVLDGLVAGGAIADDAQVVDLYAVKAYADDRRGPGCSISIEEA